MNEEAKCKAQDFEVCYIQVIFLAIWKILSKQACLPRIIKRFPIHLPTIMKNCLGISGHVFHKHYYKATQNQIHCFSSRAIDGHLSKINYVIIVSTKGVHIPMHNDSFPCHFQASQIAKVMRALTLLEYPTRISPSQIIFGIWYLVHDAWRARRKTGYVIHPKVYLILADKSSGRATRAISVALQIKKRRKNRTGCSHHSLFQHWQLFSSRSPPLHIHAHTQAQIS